jgi:hypothetical protein
VHSSGRLRWRRLKMRIELAIHFQHTLTDSHSTDSVQSLRLFDLQYLVLPRGFTVALLRNILRLLSASCQFEHEYRHTSGPLGTSTWLKRHQPHKACRSFARGLSVLLGKRIADNDLCYTSRPPESSLKIGSTSRRLSPVDLVFTTAIGDKRSQRCHRCKAMAISNHPKGDTIQHGLHEH